jgi:hypothetical protein
MNNDRATKTIRILTIIVGVIPIGARLVDLEEPSAQASVQRLPLLDMAELTVKLYVSELPGGIEH